MTTYNVTLWHKPPDGDAHTIGSERTGTGAGLRAWVIRQAREASTPGFWWIEDHRRVPLFGAIGWIDKTGKRRARGGPMPWWRSS